MRLETPVRALECLNEELQEDGEALRRVMNRENVDLARAGETVDDSIRAVDDFANVVALELGHRTTRLREPSEALRRGDDPSDHDVPYVRGFLSNEGADRAKVGSRAGGPEDSSHERSCFLTSSWGMTSPLSDCRRPSSIFAMKQRRSMASSRVASSGRAASASTARCFAVCLGIWHRVARQIPGA